MHRFNTIIVSLLSYSILFKHQILIAFDVELLMLKTLPQSDLSALLRVLSCEFILLITLFLLD